MYEIAIFCDINYVMQYQGQRTDIVWMARSLEIAVDNTPPNTTNPNDAACLKIPRNN